MENILNNNEYKIFFLKAILLGIDYGTSSNASNYKKNIQNEIYTLLKNISDKNIEIPINKDLKLDNPTSEIEITNNMENVSNNDYNLQIMKHENIILNLVNQQKNYLNLIHNLSMHNYSYNFSRISILKTNLSIINQEIEKNKLILKKYKETYKIKESLKLSNISKGKTPNKIKYNEEKIINNNNKLVNELERTLGNLSSLFIS